MEEQRAARQPGLTGSLSAMPAKVAEQWSVDGPRADQQTGGQEPGRTVNR